MDSSNMPLHSVGAFISILLATALYTHTYQIHAADHMHMSQNGMCGLTKRPPQSIPLRYCKYYESSSCCSREDTENVVKQVIPYYKAYIDSENNDDEEEAIQAYNCLSWTSTMLCLQCDPYIGTLSINNGNKHNTMETPYDTHDTPIYGVCSDACQRWYHACQHEFFAYIDSSDAIMSNRVTGLHPCDTMNDLICSPLKDIVSRGSELCQQYQIPIANAEDNSSNHCYDIKQPKTFESAGRIPYSLVRPIDTHQQPHSHKTTGDDFTMEDIYNSIRVDVLSYYLRVKVMLQYYWYHLIYALELPTYIGNMDVMKLIVSIPLLLVGAYISSWLRQAIGITRKRRNQGSSRRAASLEELREYRRLKFG